MTQGNFTNHHSRRKRQLWIWCCLTISFSLFTWNHLQADPVTSAPNQEPHPAAGVPVVFDKETLFFIYDQLGPFTAQERATAITGRIAQLANDPFSSIYPVTAVDRESTSELIYDDKVIVTITDRDARPTGRGRYELAKDYAQKIQTTLEKSRAQRTSWEPIMMILIAIVDTVILMVFLFVLGRTFPKVYASIESWRGTRLRSLSFRGLELLSADHVADSLVFLARTVRVILLVLALYLYLHFLLGLFPWTHDLERTLLDNMSDLLKGSEALQANLAALIIGILLTLVATGLFLALLKIFQQLFPRMIDAVSGFGRTKLPSLKFQRVELLSASQMTEGLLTLIRILRFAAVALLVYFYATSLLGFFPWTRNLSVELLGYVLAPVKTIGAAFVAALPNVIAIAVIVLVTRYIIKLIRMVFLGIERGAISFPGFLPEWAVPTFKIVRFLVLVFAAVAIFPYIPGSQSEAFKGISVFLGVLVSLGAAGSISHVVAGVVLTYMQPFNVGDRVKIADTVGDIMEKTLLVTRVRTIKNVDITIPNGMVLGSHIVNFSSSARDRGLILNTNVTIGYDAPWRKVHELLIAAARATTHIVKEPEPFVLQTSLNDFYVTYEINAYTDQPNLMANIYAELHQNIQDRFNEAGIEIMSPHYTQIRDGNKTAIPEQYLPKHYKASGFRILPVENPLSKLTDPTRPETSTR